MRKNAFGIKLFFKKVIKTNSFLECDFVLKLFGNKPLEEYKTKPNKTFESS